MKVGAISTAVAAAIVFARSALAADLDPIVIKVCRSAGERSRKQTSDYMR